MCEVLYNVDACSIADAMQDKGKKMVRMPEKEEEEIKVWYRTM